MRSIIWFFFLPTCVSFLCACVFYALRDEANQPEHAQGWLGGKSYWLFLLLLLFMILKFPGDNDKSKVHTLRVHWGYSFGSPGKKKKKASPGKDYMFGTLTWLERDLVNFVSRVQNLKLTVVTCGNHKYPNLEVLADAHNNITIYEVWGKEDPDQVDSCVEAEET
ncbi:hypothetical protein FD755_024556 [Muntiacus reevesi]|uniref:Uncharacterized protein n=1 Tax=Muntiacus reevesi TaxID=9886 RepID=A0A5N3UWQ6_MUNRE|nr:hypothetical protein FD755_024556 [Muntiacus reevesi]